MMSLWKTKPISPTQCYGDPCYALEMFMVSGNKDKNSQSYSGSDFCFVHSFILLWFLESVLLQSTMNQENENREPKAQRDPALQEHKRLALCSAPNRPPLDQSGGGSRQKGQ